MVDRWAGPFLSPNQAALELAVVLVVLVAGLYMARLMRSLSRRRGTLIILWMAILPVIALLCATRSRAGWLATLAGVGIIFLWNPRKWIIPASIIALLAVGISLWPGAIERVQRAPSDAIAGERMILWKSTLAIIRDYPLWGAGDKFTELLDSWYLSRDLGGRFYTPLNDFLALASRFGLAALGAFFAAIALCAKLAWRQKNQFAGAVAVAVIAEHIVAGQFQAHLWSPFSMASALAAMAVAALLGRGNFSLRLVVGSLALGACMASLCWWLACFCSAGAKWQTFTDANGQTVVTPRGKPNVRLITVVVDAEKDRRGFRWEVMECSRHCSSSFTIKVQGSDGWDHRSGIIAAWHEAGTNLWLAARHGSVAGCIIPVDPLSIPDRGDHREPVHVLIRDGAPFVPDQDDISLALQDDAVGSSSVRVPRQASVWDTIELLGDATH